MPARHLALRIAGLAAIAAGLIHAAVVPDHARVWVPSGVFFGLLAAFQLLWGAAVVWRPEWLQRGVGATLALVMGFVVAVGSAAFWGVTRSVTGEPLGPNAGAELPIGPAGIAGTGLEILTALALLAAVLSSSARVAGGAVMVAIASIGIAVPTAWGMNGALGHDHGAHAGTDHHDGDPDHQQDVAPPTPDGASAPDAPSTPAADAPAPQDQPTAATTDSAPSSSQPSATPGDHGDGAHADDHAH